MFGCLWRRWRLGSHWPQAPAPALLFARQAANAGCDSLTQHAVWQSGAGQTSTVRISPAMAEQMKVKNLGWVKVTAADQSFRARVRVAPETPPNLIVAPEGSAQARKLAPSRIEPDCDCVYAAPAAAALSSS